MPKQKETTKVKPVHEIRLGRIKAAIWRNETQNGSMFNVTISRLWKDGAQWRDSASFGRDDLPLVAKLADRVHTWIFDQIQEHNGAQSHETDGCPAEDDSPDNEPRF